MTFRKSLVIVVVAVAGLALTACGPSTTMPGNTQASTDVNRGPSTSSPPLPSSTPTAPTSVGSSESLVDQYAAMQPTNSYIVKFLATAEAAGYTIKGSTATCANNFNGQAGLWMTFYQYTTPDGHIWQGSVGGVTAGVVLQTNPAVDVTVIEAPDDWASHAPPSCG